MKSFITALRASIVLMIICGLIYPIVTTGIAQVIFPKKANGSMLEENGVVRGSELIAQDFTSPSLFHPRASAADYNPKASAATNAAVASEDYIKEVTEKVTTLRQENPSLAQKGIPADLVTTSGSGFDPDLSPDAAKAQISRIARETGIPESELNNLIDTHTQGRQLGVFGEPRVNVVELNLELLKRVRP